MIFQIKEEYEKVIFQDKLEWSKKHTILYKVKKYILFGFTICKVSEIFSSNY